MGLAFLFKQNVGLYLAGVASVLLLVPSGLPGAAPRLRGRLRDVARFGAGMTVMVVPPVLYFAAHGLLDELIWSAFARPLLGYLPTSGISFWEPLAWWELGSLEGERALSYFLMPYYTLLYQGALPGAALEPTYWLVGELVARLLYTSVIVAGTATLALAARRWRCYQERDRRLLALAALSAAVGASALPRADLPHLISVYPLILLLLIQLWARWVDGPAGVTRTGIRRAELATVAMAPLWSRVSRRCIRARAATASICRARASGCLRSIPTWRRSSGTSRKRWIRPIDSSSTATRPTSTS
jgi:hypothetical protein